MEFFIFSFLSSLFSLLSLPLLIFSDPSISCFLILVVLPSTQWKIKTIRAILVSSQIIHLQYVIAKYYIFYLPASLNSATSLHLSELSNNSHWIPNLFCICFNLSPGISLPIQTSCFKRLKPVCHATNIFFSLFFMTLHNLAIAYFSFLISALFFPFTFCSVYFSHIGGFFSS